MSYQEKRSIISIITTGVVYLIYCLYLFLKINSGEFDPINDFRFWGILILILIPVQIVAHIIITIIFSIINTIITREDDDPSLTDERDKLISLKANNFSYGVVGAGFLISMISLVIGYPPFVMFNIIFFSFNLAEIIGNAIQIHYYRRGF